MKRLVATVLLALCLALPALAQDELHSKDGWSPSGERLWHHECDGCVLAEFAWASDYYIERVDTIADTSSTYWGQNGRRTICIRQILDTVWAKYVDLRLKRDEARVLMEHIREWLNPPKPFSWESVPYKVYTDSVKWETYNSEPALIK